MSEDGNGQFRLRPTARIIVLGTCGHCRETWDVCRCGEHTRPK